MIRGSFRISVQAKGRPPKHCQTLVWNIFQTSLSQRGWFSS